MSIGCEGPRQEDRERIDISSCVCIVATSRLQVPILGAILGGILACNVGIIAAAGRAYCTAPFLAFDMQGERTRCIWPDLWIGLDS